MVKRHHKFLNVLCYPKLDSLSYSSQCPIKMHTSENIEFVHVHIFKYLTHF